MFKTVYFSFYCTQIILQQQYLSIFTEQRETHWHMLTETVLLQILHAKIQRLEHLIQLKDIRIEDLQTRLKQMQEIFAAAGANVSPNDRQTVVRRQTDCIHTPHGSCTVRSPNLTQRCKPPKVRTSSLGVNIAPPFPYFTPKNCHFWSRGPENQCKYAKRNICLKCLRIATIPAYYRKSGSGNTTVTSDF